MPPKGYYERTVDMGLNEMFDWIAELFDMKMKALKVTFDNPLDRLVHLTMFTEDYLDRQDERK
tara:strand:- start:3409 stop:3597 length:189 start_codon:yes stop_codon:yes gene_type:complete